MLVALLGDAHGDLVLLARRTAEAAEAGAGAAIQLGDLGFRDDLLGPGRPWPRLPIPVLALCGNHEDHAFLRRARASGLAAAWAAHGLCYQPRGSLARLGGRTVGFLGGALHADRPQDPDRANLPVAAEIDAALAAFAVRPPDLIATHSCPPGIGVGMHGSPALALGVLRHVVQAGFDPGPGDDCGEPALARLWHGLRRRPALWVFGHFHLAHQAVVEGTRFACVPDLPQPELTLWDTISGSLVLI